MIHQAIADLLTGRSEIAEAGSPLDLAAHLLSMHTHPTGGAGLPDLGVPGDPGSPGLPIINGVGNGVGNGNGGAIARIPRSSVYIGGTAPGFWHTTPVHTHFDRHTGVAKEVGGNRVANKITLAQDETGAMQYFAPVEPTGWKFKYAKRHRHHVHKVKHHHKRKHHGHKPKHHAARHGLTRKQLAAGFGGKHAMAHH